MSENRCAIVTGASRGIGLEIARKLAGRDVRCLLLARNERTLRTATESLPTSGHGEHSFLAFDLGQPDRCEAILSEAISILGHVNYLINAAGIAASAPLHRFDTESFSNMLRVNAESPARLIAGVATHFLEHSEDRAVVSIASVAGLRGYPYVSAYCASKHALVGFTRAAAKELAASGARFNAICPGYVDTEMTRATIEGIAAKTGMTEIDARGQLEAMSPQGRLFPAKEIADLALFLLSDAAKGINGQAIPVCGGEIA